MTKITVYSKCVNDVEFRTYQHQKNEKDITIHSKVTGKVVIKGLTNWMREKRLQLIYADNSLVAETLVEESLWNAILEERGTADPLLTRSQIYTAKNTNEAKAMRKDAMPGLTDMLTPTDLKKGNKNVNPVTKLI